MTYYKTKRNLHFHSYRYVISKRKENGLNEILAADIAANIKNCGGRGWGSHLTTVKLKKDKCKTKLKL